MHTISVQQASINYLIGRTQELEANLMALSHYRGVLGGLRKIVDQLTGGGVRILAKRVLNVAAALAANRERSGRPQILIDVTALAGHDVRTGIQRVTRGILMALISDPPPGYRIEPIRADGDLYLYARRFTCERLGLQEDVLTDEPVEAGHGDVFLALEWAAGLVPAMKPWFLKRRRSGMQIVFVVYDLLALVRPEFPPPAMPPAALEWLTTVAEIADKVARDIPVFREVAGEHAYYFRGGTARALADALRTWLSLGDAIPASTGMPWLTWKQSSRQLLDVVLGRRWYRSWPDAEIISPGTK